MAQHLDLDALQAAAEAAGGDEWHTADSQFVWHDDGDSVCSCYASIGRMPNPVMEMDVSAFIATANPAVILALIDRLRKAEAASKWQPIETAPKDKRVLVRTEREIYAAHWGKNPFTDDEAWVVAEWGEDREQALVKPVEWMPLPAAPTSADSEGDR